MSDDEKKNVIKETKKTKWFSIVTALLTFFKVIVDVILG